VRALIQRVKRAQVSTNGKVLGRIEKGLIVFLGIKDDDKEEDAEFLSEKIVHLRIMADEEEKMNKAVLDVGGQILVVSQFTLYADTNYGRRPSFLKAAKPEIARPLYDLFIDKLKEKGVKVQTGRFGAYMEVKVINDGPVTIMLESGQKNEKKNING